MKDVKLLLQNAKEDYLNAEISHAKLMEYKRGEVWIEPEFEPEKSAEFYSMIVRGLLRIIDKEVYINRHGAYAKGSEISIINPNLDQGGEYNLTAIIDILDDHWVVKYQEQTYHIDDISFYN